MRRWAIGVLAAILAAGCAAPEDERGGGGGGGRMAEERPAKPSPKAVAPRTTVQQAPSRALLPPGDGVADLVDAVRAAVVNIDTVAGGAPQAGAFEDYFDDRQDRPRAPSRGVGSGFVLRQDGLIVTNNHVVTGADRVTVTFADSRKLPGRVVGQDPLTDLALVRVEAKGLPTLPLADPARLRVGQAVVAVGSPLGLQQTVTAGILSAINRDIALNARVGFLQTDAPINPGNSGGPLLNLRGEVVGVNTAVAATAQGIGFAIPVETLQAVLPELERTGRVAHAWLGVGAVDLPEEQAAALGIQGGVLVGRVERGSPAARAGVNPGDVIAALNGQPVPGAAGLVRAIARMDVGDRGTVDVVRRGGRSRLAFTVEAMPPSLAGR